MSISPPSDIVLGVANAADPQKYRAAAEQLARLAGTQAPAAVKTASADAQFSLPSPAQAGLPSAASQQASPAGTASKTNAYQEFEAFLLQNFIESVLPKDSTGVFGSGTAGEIWKSMFAEHVGREIAHSTAFGIADRIARHKARIDKAISHGGGTKSTAQSLPAAALADRFPDVRSVTASKSPSILPAPVAGGLLKRRGS